MHLDNAVVSSRRRSLRPRWQRRFGAGAVAVPAAVALALAAAACGSSNSGGSGGLGTKAHPITITFANWADAESTTRPGIEKMIADFEATHPGIKVKSEPVAFSDIGHTMVLQVQSGNTPDVAELSGNDTFDVAATGALTDLDSFIGSTKSQYIPSELTAATYQGKIIALPWTVNPPALWYNKTLMKGAGLNPNDPPKTINELMTDLAAIHAKYPKVLAMGIDTTNRDFALSADWPWMSAFGAQPYNGTTATADTPQMEAFLSWMRELTQKGYLTPGHKIGDYRPLAAQNEAAFVWDQPVLQGVVQAANKETNAQFFANWGVEAQPTGPTGQSSSVELGHQLVIFKKSKYQRADWEFIQWLATSPEAITQYTVPYESSLPPLAHPTAAVAKLIDTPVLQAFANQVLPTVKNPVYGVDFSEAYSPIMAGVQEAITSSEPISKVAQTIQSTLQTAFK